MTPFAGLNTVTSIYGWRTYPEEKFHYGIDVITDGSWDIRDTNGGTVVFIGDSPADRGLYVDVLMSDGVTERWQHLDSISVSIGDETVVGTVIGTAGSTGSVTGRHLHYEVIAPDGSQPNPSPWLRLPNIVGNYPGNDDGEQPVPYKGHRKNALIRIRRPWRM